MEIRAFLESGGPSTALSLRQVELVVDLPELPSANNNIINVDEVGHDPSQQTLTDSPQLISDKPISNVVEPHNVNAQDAGQNHRQTGRNRKPTRVTP